MTQQAKEDNSANPLTRLWIGGFSLPASFWAWGIALRGLVVGINWILKLIMRDAPVAGGIGFFAWGLAVGYPSWVLWSVGTWRSGRCFRGWRGWIILSRVVIVLGWLLIIPAFFDFIEVGTYLLVNLFGAGG